MRDEAFRRLVRDAESGDPSARTELRRMSDLSGGFDGPDDPHSALARIIEEEQAQREERDLLVALRRSNRWAALACVAALAAPYPSSGWRGVLWAGACLLLGVAAGAALNRWIRGREAAARRRA